MSTIEARKVVSRAVTDDQFRELLFKNPDKALAGYQLTPVEVEALRGIPSETIDDFANNLEERISMVMVAGLLGGKDELASVWMTGGHPAIEQSQPDVALADEGGVHLDQVELEGAPVEPFSAGDSGPNLELAQMGGPDLAVTNPWLYRFITVLGFGDKGTELDDASFY